MRQLIKILSGGIAVALLGVGLSACDPTEADPRLEPPLVRVATVEPAAPSRAGVHGRHLRTHSEQSRLSRRR